MCSSSMCRLDPYLHGIYYRSSTSSGMYKNFFKGLNPYLHGIYYRRMEERRKRREKRRVLILIYMEYTIGGLQIVLKLKDGRVS